MKLKAILKGLSISFGACLILAGIFFVVFKQVKINEGLVEFMPANTGMFIEYDLNNKDLKNLQENNFRAKARLEAMFSQTSFFGDLSKYVTDNVERVALLTVLDEEQNWEKIWLVRANNIHQINALLPKDYYFSNLNSNTIAISTNHELLRELKSNKLNFNKFKKDNFLNLYLTPEYLKFLQTQNTLEYFLILNNLNLDLDKEVQVELKAEVDKVVFELTGSKNESRKITNFKKDGNDVLKFLNSDIGWLKVANANLENLYENFVKNYLNSDNQQELEEKFEFKFEDISQILNSNSGAIILDNSNNTLDQTNFVNLNNNSWVMVMNKNLNEEQINLIKKLAKKIVAYKYPRTISKTLADKTKSNQIVADADYFSFDKTENGIEYLFYKDFKLAIYTNENYFFLGNDLDLIKNVSNNSLENKLDFDFNKSYEASVINGQKFSFGVLRFFDKIIFGVEENSRVKVEGEIKY